MNSLSSKEVEKRLRAWEDVTVLSLELKKAFLRKRYPELTEKEICEVIRKEHEIAKGYLLQNDTGLNRGEQR